MYSKIWSFFILAFTTGCTLATSQPNKVLIIAVDRLGVSDINCIHELKLDQQSGFHLLCADSIRFTHAYTTSLLSQPALTSLLTGLYPVENQVHNNGPDFLSAELMNLGKVAHREGYRTALFSGSTPILRSSGLQNGFDLFDDNIIPSTKSLFRPADEIFAAYSSWTKESESNSFAVLYLSDLLFTNKETVDQFGEARNLSYESQLDYLDNNLYSFFSALQKNHLWDKTLLVLVGLQGHRSDPDMAAPDLNNQNSNPWLNLHSDNTQVALLVKPPRKPRDEGLAWTFDAPISLVDIGNTLNQWIEQSEQRLNPQAEKTGLQRVSLIEAWHKPMTAPFPERWILTESAWGLKKSKPMVFSLLKNHLLLIHDQRDHFFNTLTDRAETAEISSKDATLQTEITEIATLKLELGIPLSVEPNSSLPPPLPLLEATTLIQNGQWIDLAKLARQYAQGDWLSLAQKHLPKTLQKDFADPCLNLINRNQLEIEKRKTCTDKNILILMDELQNNLSTETLSKRILHVWKKELLFDKLLITGFHLGEIWNLSPQHQEEHLRFIMALNLPLSAKLRTQLLSIK